MQSFSFKTLPSRGFLIRHINLRQFFETRYASMRLLLSTALALSAITAVTAACDSDHTYELCCRPLKPGNTYQLCEEAADDSSCRTDKNFALSCCATKVCTMFDGIGKRGRRKRHFFADQKGAQEPYRGLFKGGDCLDEEEEIFQKLEAQAAMAELK